MTLVRWKKQSAPFLFCSLLIGFFFLLFICHAEGKESAKFTIETIPSEKGPIDSKMWTVGTAIIITEPIVLASPCDRPDGEVNIQRRKIFVKLKPMERAALNSECNQTALPAGVKVMIRDLPTGNFSVTLETPQRTVTENLLIDW